jgi:hypothetical protein
MAIKFDTDIDGTAFNGITGLASSTPLANGTAAVGESTAAAREDHVHGTDTSRAPTVSPTFTGTVVLPSGQALIAPALGTVASGNIAACTGLPIINGTTGTLSVARGGTGVITSTGSGSNVLSTSPALNTPTIQGYAVFKGDTSGGTKLVATAVAGTTVLTLPAVTGTLATVGGEETLGGKTLSSPTFTGTVTGISKSMVGLGSVDDTADSAKNVLSATKLTTAKTIGGVSFNGTANINLPGVNTAGNQSTTGNAATSTKLATAVNIGGVPFDGSANIPQRETTHHSASFIFAVNTKQYIGLLRADSENTVVANQFLPFLAPFSGKLLKVFVRSSSGLTTGDFTLRLEKNALNVAAGTTPTTVAEIEEDGPANSTMTTYDFTSLSSPMSNSITAGDMVFISIESDTAFSGVKIYFTCLWEWDY